MPNLIPQDIPVYLLFSASLDFAPIIKKSSLHTLHGTEHAVSV